MNEQGMGHVLVDQRTRRPHSCRTLAGLGGGPDRRRLGWRNRNPAARSSDRPLVDIPWPKGQTLNDFFVFPGKNQTGQRIKDFELELKNCGPNAKFHYIKVYAW